MPGAISSLGLAPASAFPAVQPVSVAGPWPRGSAGARAGVVGAPYPAIDSLPSQGRSSRQRRRARRPDGLTADMVQSLWAALRGTPCGGSGSDRAAIRAYEPLFDHLGLLVDLLA